MEHRRLCLKNFGYKLLAHTQHVHIDWDLIDSLLIRKTILILLSIPSLIASYGFSITVRLYYSYVTGVMIE